MHRRPPPSAVPGKIMGMHPGRRLSVAVSRPRLGAGRMVLFVHGAGGRKDQWRSVWPVFADLATLVAWDAPGHGDSPQPVRPVDLAGAAWRADALDLMRRFAGEGRTVLVGHSYGCRVVLATLARLAERGEGARVDAVLLLAPPPLTADCGDNPVVQVPLWRLVRMRPALERGFRRTAWSPEADPALIDAEERAARRNRLSTLKHLMRGAEAIDPAELAAVRTPVTVLAGADDRLTPPEAAEGLAAALPHATCTVLAGCGHQIMLERPRAVMAELARLLAGPSA